MPRSSGQCWLPNARVGNGRSQRDHPTGGGSPRVDVPWPCPRDEPGTVAYGLAAIRTSKRLGWAGRVMRPGEPCRTRPSVIWGAFPGSRARWVTHPNRPWLLAISVTAEDSVRCSPIESDSIRTQLARAAAALAAIVGSSRSSGTAAASRAVRSGEEGSHRPQDWRAQIVSWRRRPRADRQ